CGPRHRRPNLDPRGGFPDGPDHAPHEGALALPVDPRMEVIGDQPERETALLGEPREPHQLARAVLLARELVAEPHRISLALAHDVSSVRHQVATRPGRVRSRAASTATWQATSSMGSTITGAPPVTRSA